MRQLFSTYRLSFKRKISLALLVNTLAGVITAQLLLTALEWRADRMQLAQEHGALAQVLAGNASAALVFGDHSAAEETLSSAWQAHDVRSAALFDAEGRLFAGENPAGAQPRTPAAWAASAAARHQMVSRAPVSIKGQRVGELVLVYDLESLYARLEGFIVSSLAACALVALLAVFVSRTFSRSIAGPVEDLSRAMADVRRSRDFGRRVASAGADEFGQLTNDFNALLADLEANESVRADLLRDLQLALRDAEKANVAKSQFLANMSHEIRTPLNGVLGMTQALALDKLEPTQRERVDIIRESGHSLLAVLNDILDLSKIEAGHFELEVMDFDLGDVARGVCAAFTESANRKGVSFGFTVASAAAGTWRGDSARVRQILYNLVSNALKFTAAGAVEVGVDKAPDGQLTVAVRDSGIGIAAEKLPQLFSKFYQTDSSNTRQYGGTGLGLAICRELAELMGGTIVATSVPGRGSVFTLTLPLEHLGPRAAGQGEPNRPEGHDDLAGDAEAPIELRILAAEDNTANQLVLRALLQALGVSPVIVGNGRLALEAWAVSEFDLILMDVQMPEMDGVAATEAIRKAEASSGRPRTPIFALSANAMNHQVRGYLECGMDGHIPKPLEIEKLVDVLSRVAEALADNEASAEAGPLAKVSTAA